MFLEVNGSSVYGEQRFRDQALRLALRSSGRTRTVLDFSLSPAYYRTTAPNNRRITMKVGVIRCMQTEDMCPGTSDFKAMQNKTGGFESVDGPIEIIGHTSCGGCPGKKAVFKAKMLAGRGADTISLCIMHNKRQPHRLRLPIS